MDLRERAIKYVRDGGSQAEAGRLFGVTSRTIYNWLHRDNLAPTVVSTRRRKLDKRALAAHVRDYPDALLRERAAHFGVRVNAVWVALGRMKIVKKND